MPTEAEPAGSVATTLGLTGVFWAATGASSQTATDDEGSTTVDDTTTRSTYDYDDDSFSSSDSTDDSVDVAPSYEAPDTSSGAS